jgi:stress response protein YsnF
MTPRDTYATGTRWEGVPVLDVNGEKVGTIEEVYADRSTGRPEWALLATGWFGMSKSFVPMGALRPDGHQLRSSYTKEHIKGAPNVDSGQELSEQEEERLFSYYGIPRHDSTDRRGPMAGQSGPDEMVRREEELIVGKVRRPSELVRMRKTVETEPVQSSVEVEREEARVIREPIRPDQQAAAGQIETGEQEMMLEREEPVVRKEAVPKERLRLEKTVHREEVPIEEQVRKERVDFEREDEGEGRSRP